jgi:hypothetical protein
VISGKAYFVQGSCIPLLLATVQFPIAKTQPPNLKHLSAVRHIPLSLLLI